MRAMLLGFLMVGLFATAAHACPMCAEAVESQAGSGSSGMVTGYFWSILFLMGMPFFLFGGFTALLVHVYRKYEGDGSQASVPEASRG